MVLGALYLQIPKIRKLTNEIKNLLMISPWTFQLQGLQGLQKHPEVFFHLRNIRSNIQPMSFKAPEVREGVEVLDVWFQIVRKERIVAKGDREVTSMLEEAALT